MMAMAMKKVVAEVMLDYNQMTVKAMVHCCSHQLEVVFSEPSSLRFLFFLLPS